MVIINNYNLSLAFTVKPVIYDRLSFVTTIWSISVAFYIKLM